MYSNCCCRCSFGPEIIKIDQSSHKMYSNNIVNFQGSTTILNAFTKKSGNLLKAPRKYYLYDTLSCLLVECLMLDSDDTRLLSRMKCPFVEDELAV